MTHVQNSLAAAAKIIESLSALEPQIMQAAGIVIESLAAGNKIMGCGNGGSAADVSDFTTEYTCRFQGDRQPYPAINLTADGGFLLAVGNDYKFEDVFSRQVRAFGKAGDVLIGVSTSGKSKNIIAAMHEAKKMDIHTIALLGKEGGDMKGLAEVELIVPATTVTARIQEAHKVMFHIICELVDPTLKR